MIIIIKNSTFLISKNNQSNIMIVETSETPHQLQLKKNKNKNKIEKPKKHNLTLKVRAYLCTYVAAGPEPKAFGLRAFKYLILQKR